MKFNITFEQYLHIILQLLSCKLAKRIFKRRSAAGGMYRATVILFMSGNVCSELTANCVTLSGPAVGSRGAPLAPPARGAPVHRYFRHSAPRPSLAARARPLRTRPAPARRTWPRRRPAPRAPRPPARADDTPFDTNQQPLIIILSMFYCVLSNHDK